MAKAAAVNFDWFAHGIDWQRRTIFLVGGVDEEMSSKALKALHVLDASPGMIFIVLNSCGGYWSDGMAIYDAIRACQNKVTISVFGEVSSMATVIFQAADVRLMSANSIMLIHYGTDGTPEPSSDLQRRADFSKSLRNRMEEIYQRRLKWNKATLRKQMAADWYLNAQDAVALNLADAVIT